MKIFKSLLILVVLMLVSTISFGATKNIQQMVFGINKADFETLKITDEQKTKIGDLLKDYGEKLDKLDKKNKDLKVSAQVLETEIADQVMLQYKLYADFKKILTKEQLSQYEKAYFVKLAEQKLYLTKKFSAFEEPLELNDEQKDKYRYLINNFDGDLLKLESEFVALLTSKQKIIYNHLKEKQMNTIVASGTEVNDDNKTKTEDKVEVNSDGKTEVKTDGKTVIVNNNNNSGGHNGGCVIQPVLWWSFGGWWARPIHHHHWIGYDRYWDVYEREWRSYWDGYWDGRWDEWWDQKWDERDWEKFWDEYDFDSEQWRYEDRIYDTGFSDGIEYDKKLYEKWADEPFDAEKGEYLDKDVPEYDSYKDIYEGANLDYKLSDYYDEKNHDWNYEKVEEEWAEDTHFNEDTPQDEVIEDIKDEPMVEPKEEPVIEPEPEAEHHEEPIVEPEHHEDHDWGGNDNWGGGGDFGGVDFGGDFGGGDFGGDW